MPKIVGIDLGTTNSLVAIVEDGVPRVLPGPDGQNLVPSVISFNCFFCSSVNSLSSLLSVSF